MPSQNLIFSPTLADVSGNGPWTDVGGHGSEWTIFIAPWPTTASVQVSNEIDVPTTPNPNNPSQTRAAYPPYPPPGTVTTYTNESHAIAATVTVTHAPSAGSPPLADGGVTFGAGPQAGFNLIYSPGGPARPGTYSVNKTTGVYSFNATDVANGYAVLLTYTITVVKAGFPLPAAYILANGTTNALIIAKSDLNVKWVRVIDTGSPATAFAYLHTGK